MSEAAGAARAAGEIIDHLELDLHYRYDHELCNALAGLDGERLAATIPHRHHELPLVVGVDQADQVT